MPRHTKEEKRRQRIDDLVSSGKTPQQAQVIVDAEDANRRVPSDISAGGDSLALGVPSKSLEAEALLEREQVIAPEQAGSQTPLRLLELLGNVGGSLMDNRAVGKANKATQQSQARANLINTLRGSQTASVSPTQPKGGILSTLSKGLSGGARAVREGREAKAAGDQAGFENEMGLGAADRAQQGLDLDASKATQERDDPIGLSDRKATYDSIGGGLYDQNPDMSPEEIALAVQEDPRFQDDVASNPRLASELAGLAVQGYRGREKDVLDQGKSQSQETRAVEKMDKEAASVSMRGFEANLRGRTLTNVFGDGNEMDAQRDAFETYRVPQMPQEFQDLAHGLHVEWTGKYHQLAFEKAEAERDAIRGQWEKEFAVQKEAFDVEETLRSAVQALPGVKAFSGQHGIGGAFQRLEQAYEKYTRDTKAGKGDRATMQLALVNQFQRLIDPATVREGDIALIREAESWWARLNGKMEGWMDGGFVANRTIDGMYAMAVELHKAHRRFVEQEVSGSIDVWNNTHRSNPVDEITQNAITTGILGGDREDEETVEIEF